MGAAYTVLNESINKCDTSVQDISRMDFHSVVHSLETFDILFTSAVGASSFCIQIGTRSRFTHVGLVVRGHPYAKRLQPKRYPIICDRDCLNEVAVWESNEYDDRLDLKTNAPSSGCHLVLLADITSRNYIKVCGFRHLSLPVSSMGLCLERLYQFIEDSYGKPYDKNWTLALLKFNIPSKKHDQYFCSSLLAATLYHTEIFRPAKNNEILDPREFRPSDFEQGSNLPMAYYARFASLTYFNKPSAPLETPASSTDNPHHRTTVASKTRVVECPFRTLHRENRAFGFLAL